MGNTEGLDKWIDKNKEDDSEFSSSLFPHERITLCSLKERIAELERMRDQILYELDRLRSFSEGKKMH
jgi:hypothetical protein